ncbi:DUF2339 domain-containing protein [Solihabitans fulvus]|uniref:DUF2339 domain-containing protein n=1 Tax=Solihabitans fulvus TaxID=1892852 RepID=A0A5B2X1G6_9PSEU|nr:DUF2339 domain-containing protein [Solihabitans fulvus]KAA2256947.1 DUF2339 domain-containing protein [Solihabitans fulvus]
MTAGHPPSDPLLRLADELAQLGSRLELVSVELRRSRRDGASSPTAAAAPTPPPVVQPTVPPAQAHPRPPVQPTIPAQQPYPAIQPYPAAAPLPVAPPMARPVPVPNALVTAAAKAEPAKQDGPAEAGAAAFAAWNPVGDPGSPPPPPPPIRTLFERLSKDGAGSRLLAWVGGAITLLGVVLLLILAVQRGYLGPLPRVLGGAGLGIGLIGIGLWLHRSPAGRTGAFALAATGIAALYLDSVAATSLYDFLPAWAGLVLGLAVAGGGLLLAARWDSQLLGVGVVVACAVCAPVITDGFTPLLVAFLLVLLAATTPAQLRRSWPGLAVAAGVPPLVAGLIADFMAYNHQVLGKGDPLPTAGAALAAALVGTAVAVLTARRRPEDAVPIALLVGAPAPALAAAPVLDRPYAAGIAGVVALLTLAVWVAGRRRLPARFVAVAGAVAGLALFQATATALDGSARSTSLLGEAAVFAFVATRLRTKGTLLVSALFGAVGTVLALVLVVPPELLFDAPGPHHLVDGSTLAAGLTSSLMLALFAVALPWASYRLGVLPTPATNPPAWLAAGVTVLYGAAGAVLCAALLIAPDRGGFLVGHVLVTVSWTVVALVLLLRGIDVLPLRVSGLVLVGAAVAKLVLFDLRELDGMARVAAFLCAGLILLAAGTRYARLVADRRLATD